MRNRLGRQVAALILWIALSAVGQVRAEDWGAYAIVPASATNLTLEVVGAGSTEGAGVSIGRPNGSPSQKWTITPKEGDAYVIRPVPAAGLVLAAAKGGTRMGTPIVLEADRGEPWQRWSLSRNEDGSYGLIPAHVRGMGLDHLGGDPRPGAKIDLWENRPGDRHLHWFVRPLAGSPSVAVGGVPESPPSPYTPPELRPGELRPGRVEAFTFATSTIYPGTTRQVHVFIPAQYDGSKPACVLVKFDGYNPAEKPLLEAMIAAGELPVTVGVFVRPGDLPSPVKGTIGRRNRCFEYDAVGEANARFLVEEILPEVGRRFDLKLSASGNDRSIAGGSSGGIAAFNAAFVRPDLFSRVYANSGSFVAFRGGHEFPTLVRKFEPRPIRAYLTTGMRDMENAAGDWFLLDLEMDKALKFSGYDYQFRVINGGHVAGYYDHFREAMAYLWKDWPRPIEPGPGAPRVRDLIFPGEPWRLVAEGLRDVRAGASNERGEVVFVDPSAHAIRKMDVDGLISEFLPDASQADGLSFGPRGELYAVSGRTGQVLRFEGAGSKSSVVADGLFARHVLARPEGGLFVAGRESGEDHDSVWFVKEGVKRRVDSAPRSARGLAYRPDRWLLAVADGRSKWAYSYRIQPDGSLTDRERFFWLHVPDWEDDAGAEGICYAREGQLLIATRFGIQSCADDGPSQVILPLPGRSRPLGLCFGGRDHEILYAFCGDRIYRRKLKVHGIVASTPITPVRGTPL